MDLAESLRLYPHRLPPFSQQSEALERSLSKRYFALFMEQGTGKTKVIIDTVVIHYWRGNINGLLVAAPMDVHEQWVLEQLPLHVPSLVKLRCAIWHSSNAKAVRTCKELCSKPLPDTLSVLAMNHEAFSTGPGRSMALAFMRTYKTLLAVDESDLAIRTPRAERTKTLIHKVGPLAVMRRILTGTPAEKPFDLFAPFRFLHEDITGFDSFQAFKHRYATWTKNFMTAKTAKGPKLVEYEVLTGYQNIEELQAKLAPFTYRKRKIDCLNLPPKIFGMRRVHLSSAQKDVYAELKANGLVLLREAEAHERQQPVQVAALAELTEDELIARTSDKHLKTTTELKLTLLLRLQQCVGGFVTDDNGVTRAIDGADYNPRMVATHRLVEGALVGEAKVIIWAIYRAEMKALGEQCTALFGDRAKTTAIYGGQHTKDQRRQLIEDFKNSASDLRILISHEKSLGVGMNFTVAQTEIFYTSGPSGRARVQAEDRCHRIGQTGAVNIYDFNAYEVPVDVRMENFRKGKLEFNATVMGWTANQLEEVF